MATVSMKSFFKKTSNMWVESWRMDTIVLDNWNKSKRIFLQSKYTKRGIYTAIFFFCNLRGTMRNGTRSWTLFFWNILYSDFMFIY